MPLLRPIYMTPLLTIALFLLPLYSKAQNLELKPGIPRCQEELKICSYTTQNIAARALIARVNAVLFPSEPLDPREGYINRLSAKEITFWFNGDELRQRFIAIVAQLDVLEDFTPGPLIAFETEVFAITEEGLINLHGSLGLSNIGANAPTNPNAGFTAAFGVGNFTLAVSLSAVLSKGQAHKITTVRQILPNLASLNFKHTSKIFISPTPGQIQEQEIGIKIGGELSLARNGDRRVLAHNYNLFYGVEERHPIDGPRVNALEFTTPELVLDNGISHTLVSLNGFNSSRMVGIGLPMSFNSSNMRTKLLVITRAQAISYDEFIEENRRLRQFQLRTSFSEDEVAAFPPDELTLSQVLNEIKTYSHLTLSGEQILGLKLDAALARKSTYKRVVRVTIKAPGYKQQAVRSIEQLMLAGIKLDTLPPKILAKNIIPFTITFKTFPGFKLFPTQRVKIYYNPQTRQWQ